METKLPQPYGRLHTIKHEVIVLPYLRKALWSLPGGGQETLAAFSVCFRMKLFRHLFQVLSFMDSFLPKAMSSTLHCISFCTRFRKKKYFSLYWKSVSGRPSRGILISGASVAITSSKDQKKNINITRYKFFFKIPILGENVLIIIFSGLLSLSNFISTSLNQPDSLF